MKRMLKPRDYQKEAINNVVAGFKKADRGQLIMPCGTGKTLISLWIYEKMNPKFTLVLFPSLSLLKQTKDVWLEGSKKGFPYLCVCSDKTVDKGIDSIHIDISELGSNVTTEPDQILEFMKSHNEVVLFSTYHSLPSIIIAVQGSGLKFDLAICDEAHRTAGSIKNVFTKIHDNTIIPVSKRLYMTATPRVMRDIRNNTKENINYIADMDNIEVFGSEFYRMSFKEAIESGILVDYRVVAVNISDDEIKNIIEEQRSLNNIIRVEDVLNNYAINIFIRKYNAKHIITFHSSVKRAMEFQERSNALFPNLNCFHVSGRQESKYRNGIIKDFSKSKAAIITNAKCLNEGVDVPNADTVFFTDDKSSRIDIIQALGRVLRKSNEKNKKYGYVVIPLYNSTYNKTDNSAVGEFRFRNIINVLRNLASSDERIFDFIRYIKRYDQVTNLDMPDSSPQDMVEFINHHEFINYEDEKKKLYLEMLDKIRVPYVSYEQARSYAHSLKLSSRKKWMEHVRTSDKPIDIPSYPDFIYQKKGWKDWMDFLNTNNKKFISNDPQMASYEEAKKILMEKNIRSYREFYNASWSLGRDFIPVIPDKFYKNKGWVSWADFLGYPEIPKCREYLDEFKAKDIIKSLGIKSRKEWLDFYSVNECVVHYIPKNLPKFYSNNKYKYEWREFFIGQGIGYYEAREIIKELNLNIKTRSDWLKYSRKHHTGLPIYADFAFRNKGWISWPHFLGLRD